MKLNLGNGYVDVVYDRHQLTVLHLSVVVSVKVVIVKGPIQGVESLAVRVVYLNIDATVSITILINDSRRLRERCNRPTSQLRKGGLLAGAWNGA
jgi:hypothetical protein